MITINRVSNIAEVDKKEWNHLLARSGNKSIFMTWEWLTTWWEVYGGSHELWWLLAKNKNGELVGSAPLYIRRHRNGLVLPHREIRFIGTGAPVSPEHLDILADRANSHEVLKAMEQFLINRHQAWDVLFLMDLTNANGTSHPAALRLAGLLSEQNISTHIEDQFPFAPYVPLQDQWETYFKSLGKWLRRTIVRQRNKQTRELDMSFYIWSPKEGGFDSAFDRFEKLYALRKESVKVENKFEESYGYRKFHRLLAFRFAENGWLNLAFLKIGDYEVACEYTFKYLDTLYSYQCGFDPQFGKHNVFKVLRSYVIENAILEGFKEFDLLRGEESYKYDWKALTRKKQMVRCFSPTFYGRTLRSVLNFKRTGKQILSRFYRKSETSVVNEN